MFDVGGLYAYASAATLPTFTKGLGELIRATQGRHRRSSDRSRGRRGTGRSTSCDWGKVFQSGQNLPTCTCYC